MKSTATIYKKKKSIPMMTLKQSDFRPAHKNQVNLDPHA